MKIFLSGTEHVSNYFSEPMKYNLNSYYYIRKDLPDFEKTLAASELVLVDSGAFTVIHGGGRHIDWDKYVEEYIAFIKKYDCAKILGFIEIDIDIIVGLDKVEEYRKMLNKASPGKIIPVWHKTRGIEKYKDMCKEHSGGIVAVPGRANSDIRVDQFDIFLNYAWSKNCRLHALAMTKKKVLDKIPFDYVDSTSWLLGAMKFGNYKGMKITKDLSSEKRKELYCFLYKHGINLQTHYENKWKYYEDGYKRGITCPSTQAILT